MTEPGYLYIISHNLRGLNEKNELEDYMQQIKHTDAQIICLQKTMLTGGKKLSFLDWKTKQLNRNNKRGGGGVSISIDTKRLEKKLS